MKYFTPELFMAYNSPDDEVAARADSEWDEATVRYKDERTGIIDRMPAAIRDLATMCLHDAEVISRNSRKTPLHALIERMPFLVHPEMAIPLWTATDIISLRLDDEFIFLYYSLYDEVTVTPPPVGWAFGRGPETWLYDEVGVLRPMIPWPVYVHRILLSSGVTLDIPFGGVFIHRVTYPLSVKAERKS